MEVCTRLRWSAMAHASTCRQQVRTHLNTRFNNIIAGLWFLYGALTWPAMRRTHKSPDQGGHNVKQITSLLCHGIRAENVRCPMAQSVGSEYQKGTRPLYNSTCSVLMRR